MSLIKSILKKSTIIRAVLQKGTKYILAALVKVTPLLASKYLYRKTTGKKLDIKNPKDFNEKLQWLKLYWQHPLVRKCADKYEVREYVKNCGCEEILNELYGVYDDVRQIEWDLLPDKFVLKTTNSCGTNIICTDKSKLNRNESFGKLRKWLKTDYGLCYAEIHYSKIKPRIICEKYIESDGGALPKDYKIFCFNGTPRIIQVITDRGVGQPKRYFYDLEWNVMDLTKEYLTEMKELCRPKNLDQMIAYSRRLAKGFPFVRVDFYDTEERAILGEMTFTPVGGLATYYREEALKKFGDWISLPKKYTAPVVF